MTTPLSRVPSEAVHTLNQLLGRKAALYLGRGGLAIGYVTSASAVSRTVSLMWFPVGDVKREDPHYQRFPLSDVAAVRPLPDDTPTVGLGDTDDTAGAVVSPAEPDDSGTAAPRHVLADSQRARYITSQRRFHITSRVHTPAWHVV